MGWRDAWVRQLEKDDPEVLTYRLCDRLAAALLEMPPADRIALARELLKGTDHRVAALPPVCNVYACQATEGLGGAWGCGLPDQRCALRQKSEMDAADEGGALFARRAAMLGDEG